MSDDVERDRLFVEYGAKAGLEIERLYNRNEKLASAVLEQKAEIERLTAALQEQRMEIERVTALWKEARREPKP